MVTALAATFDTPDGPFSIVAADDAVLASGWTGQVDALVGLIHPSLRPNRIVDLLLGSTGPDSGTADAAKLVVDASQAVRDYYEGDYGAPAAVPVAQRSGEFRQQAWEVLRTVGPGAPISYAEFAARVGRPRAIRAAAGACAFNAAALFVPCHRVTRSDGTLGGFRYGLPIKAALLAREAASAQKASRG